MTESDVSAPRAEATGVVLAGGKSARMGREKAALLLGGEPLVRRTVRRLQRALAEVIVAGPAELAVLVPSVRVVTDERPGQGPLAGVAGALRAVSTDWVFVVACDMPFVAPALVRAMVNLASVPPEVDAVVLETERGTEQLHALYNKSCLPKLEEQLAAGDLAFHHLLDRIRVRVVHWSHVAHYDPDGLSSFNVNTLEDWERAQAIFQRLLTDF